MGAKDLKIDPKTRDYVLDAATGAPKYVVTIETKIYHAFQGRRGRWPGDGEHGSDLWIIARGGVTAATVRRAEDALRLAADPFIAQGLARDFDVISEGTRDGRIFLRTEITDVQAGPIDVTDLTPFGA